MKLPRNGDVQFTHANISFASRELGYKPSTDLQTGLKKFVRWCFGKSDWTKAPSSAPQLPGQLEPSDLGRQCKKMHCREMDGFTVNVPELKLLRQYQNDAIRCTRRSHVICTTCEGTI
ncbi:hypothetical protein POM88_039619 [Heracleum sosnowskyi]|uniref:Uncharacterized protein n=1 Tax=Heracleum sosnowskyi TaxID=360622 RepID=A0AAD8HCK0_9APIA|nr:hypothetical protein POM88_039619 [Heracleum sosnowskyi]